MSGEKQTVDHSGHRQRLKKQFLDAGLEGFSDINALELLLFYAIPRRDTNEIAHRLLDRFGSFTAVLEAKAEELEQVDGISGHSAMLIALIPQLNKRYMTQKSMESDIIASYEAAGNYFIPKFAYEANECAYALFLDGKLSVINCRRISDGIVNGTDIGIRSVCELALRFKASYVILAHNHPTGNLMPSKEDMHATEALRKALDIIGVVLKDHIIVAGENYISFSRHRMIERDFM